MSDPKKNAIWRFSTAQRVVFGRGCRRLLVSHLKRAGCTVPAVITDRQVAQTGPIAELIAELSAQLPRTIVFLEGRAEPSVETAMAAVESVAEARPDCVVGIGGGSNLDVAKIAAIVLRHGGSPADYFGFDAVPGPVLPIFALPTTAGTGSEVSHSAVLTDAARRTKVSTLSAWLRPTAALVDPQTTDSCPREVTAHSGIDALVHAIEAYTNRDYSQMIDVDAQARAYEGSYPLTRLLAGEAIRLIGRSLENACADPTDTRARDDMAHGACLAGMAFSNSGVGIVHALEYPIGALTHCSHGEGNGLLLPHVMRFNLPHRFHEFGDIARWLGANVIGLSQRKTAEAAISRVVEIQKNIGLRTRLRDLGLPQDSLSEVARTAISIRRLMDLNVVRPSVEDLESILRAAY